MADRCGNTASFHQLGSRYAEPVIVGNFDEPAAVPVSGADLAGCFAVCVAAFVGGVQSVAKRH
jgi:hypothetical protein